MSDHVIYEGRAEEYLPAIASGSIALIATDPPYMGVKGEAWDNQWKTDTDFLDWMGSLCEQWRRVLAPSGSLYVFASPQMAARMELKIGENFNVLNSVRWLKRDGWHQKAEKESLLSFLSPWEACIFAEQRGREYADAAKSLHKDVYAPLGRYIQTERERAGRTRTTCLTGKKMEAEMEPCARRMHLPSLSLSLPRTGAVHLKGLTRSLFRATMPTAEVTRSGEAQTLSLQSQAQLIAGYRVPLLRAERPMTRARQ